MVPPCAAYNERPALHIKAPRMNSRNQSIRQSSNIDKQDRHG